MRHRHFKKKNCCSHIEIFNIKKTIVHSVRFYTIHRIWWDQEYTLVAYPTESVNVTWNDFSRAMDEPETY